METQLKNLIGKKIEKILMDDRYLKFVTDKGEYIYGVSGDCCSYSYIYDFYGVDKLLKGNPVIDVKQVELTKDDKSYIDYAPEDRNDHDGDYIDCYGYQIFVDDPEWGEMTACFSFRNVSNGYYGGAIDELYPRTEIGEYQYKSYNAPNPEDAKNLIEITSDVIDVTKLC